MQTLWCPGPEPRPRPVVPPRLDPASEAHVLAVLDAPLVPGETAMAGFARKERELAAVFASLSIVESRVLYGRLSGPRAGDALASRFVRLVPDRRDRLLRVLADARRREARARAGVIRAVECL